MGYELLANGAAQFAVDWDIVGRIVRSYHTASLQLAYAREITMSQSHWYNPRTWSLPAISHVEVDWAKVRTHADAFAQQDVRNMRVEAKYNALRIVRRLEALIDITAYKKETFIDWIGTVQTQNMVSIGKAVDDYASSSEIAQFVRDTSADGLMVGASVLTGSQALAALGGASFLTGVCRFEDRSSVGASMMQGAGSFAFAYVRLGKAYSFGDDAVLALVQAPWTTGTELVGGASISRAVIGGAVKLTGPSPEALFKLGPARTLFDKVAMPIVIDYGGEHVASKFLSTLAAGAAPSRIDGGRNGSANGSEPSTDIALAGPRRPGQLIDDSTLSNRLLLHLAFVNMQKGVGRGW
jgi:hypothetical protein